MKTKENIMANWLLFITAAFLLICPSGSVPSSSFKNRIGRQWVGELTAPVECTFPVNGGRNVTSLNNSPVERVSFCNFTTGGDGVLSWRKGLASLSNWLGGPETDASNSTDGGYAFFETSFLPGQQHQQQQLPGVQPKAWLKSPVYQATTPHGHCLRFSYNIQGVSASKLRLLRVQMVPTFEGHSSAPSISSSAVPLIVNSILMPSASSQQKRQIGSDPGLLFASPWTPFQTILLNKTGWQEVVDEVWLSSDSTRGQWLDGHVTYSSPYPHAFIFEAVPNLAYAQYRGHVAIDDIQFSNGPCAAECEFNVDFCQWSNDPDGDFDWSLSRGSLWTSTGPLRDQLSSLHNFNFGGYAFIDSRHPHYAGSRASLTSDVIPATSSNAQSDNALCFVFWVHMFGAGIGSLRVFQKVADNTSGSAEQEIWQLSTQSGPRDSWYRAQVTLASPLPFKIRVEASVGESGYGDIAVDSFRIENGSCPGLPEWAVNRGFDCTFQNGLCGWVLTNGRPGITSMWTRSNADIFSGRPDGHSQQNVLSHLPNSYMLFDTYLNGHTPGSRGFVSSQLQRSKDPHCLSFWFYLASASLAHPRMGALEVVLYEPDTASNKSSNDTINAASKHTSVVSRILWRLENHQQEKWLSAQVSFVPASGGYISFVGIRGDGLRGIIAIDDVTLFKGYCQVLPVDAAVSPLDCSFDQNLCNWSVDSQSILLPVGTESSFTTEKEVSDATETPLTITTSRLDSEVKTTPEGEDEQPIIFPADGTTTETPVSLSTAIGDVALPSTGIVELIPPQTTMLPATEATSQPSSQMAAAATSVSENYVSPAVTTEMLTEGFTSSVFSTTPSPTTAATTSSSTVASVQFRSSPTNPATGPSIVVKPVSENVSKDSTVRGVSGLYDEITSFGANTIEVISTSRDGATKSIIISQPVRNRYRRSGKWIGYNHPRHSRIVNLRSSPEGEGVWRRPKPVPHWLRSRNPNFEDGQRMESNPYSVHQAFSSQRTSSPPKLFGFSNIPRTPVSEPIPSHSPVGSSNSSQSLGKDEPRWLMSSVSSSLYGVRDHTLQLAEGGYVYVEGKGKLSVSKLFSPPFPGNATHCLSFFFTMAYNSPNSTLTVYRLSNGPLDELWRVTSAALDRSGNRNKSPWIPARVPIPSSEELDQTIVIEASTDSGGIGIDDIRFKNISCSIRP